MATFTFTSTSHSPIQLTAEGRRIYVTGNTYPVKSRLRAIGCKWDGDRKAWWIGVTKRAEIERLVESLSSSVSDRPAPGQDTRVVAKAKYKGRVYYVAWMGTTKRGTEAARLVFRDGSKEFWKDLSEIEIVKRYGREDWDTGRVTYPTIRSLREYAEQAKKAEKEGYSSPAAMRAERRGICREPGCCQPAVPGKDGLCERCFFDEYDL